jgi:ZIP family zinc transporter
VAGEKAGFLLTIGFSLEMLSLGLATCATCRKYRWSVIKSLLPVLGAVLAFGLAALLYLVTQELLVEAHEVRETVRHKTEMV